MWTMHEIAEIASNGQHPYEQKDFGALRTFSRQHLG